MQTVGAVPPPHSFPPSHQTLARPKRAPSYLYLKGTIYYFRYKFTETERNRFASHEIRMSLRTGFLLEARRYARQLRACLDGLLMDNDTSLSRTEIRAKLAAKLEQLLNASSGTKRPPSIADIRQRMDAMRQKILDEADATLYRPEPGVLFDENHQPGTVSPSDSLEHDFQIFQNNAANNPKALLAAHYPDAIIEMLHDGVFKPEELTHESILQILNEYNKMQITLNRILQAREHGDYAYERQFLQGSIPQRVDNSKSKKTKTILLAELIELYAKDKIEEKEWTERNISTHRSRIEPILDVLGNVNIEQISKNDIKKFKKILCMLPPNRKKKKEYIGKSVEEIIAMNPETTLSPKTINEILHATSSMLEWAVREDLLQTNIAKGFKVKDDAQDIDKRMPFTNDEIKSIFFSGDYTLDQFDNPAYYWAPLIALYTGMRREEICQLHCKDIYQEDDIWIFDVCEDSKDSLHDKELKTKNARRKIPIHDVLIRLGFIEYLKSVKGVSNRLFPSLSKSKNVQKYGINVGKQFSYWLKKKGVKTSKNSFHSLRHTFSNYFKFKDMHTDLFRQVFGHEIKELAGRQYGSKFPPKLCYERLISKLHYDGEPQGGQPEPAD